jgi:hypothetical protein
MSLKEIRLSAKFGYKLQKEFNIETWAISELFWSKLKKYETSKIMKCNIILSDSNENIENKHSLHMNVKNIILLFDFNSYFSLNSKHDKKLMQLEVLYKGMKEIAFSENWEIEPLKNAYLECIEQKLENKFIVKDKLIQSPDRKNKAGLFCNWDIDLFVSFLVIFDRIGIEIQRIKFIEKEPHFGDFIYYTKMKWIDNENIQIEWEKNKKVLNICDK